jgi:DNA-directed RNA polymerase beta' subunit
MVEQEVLDCMNDIINTVVKKEKNRIKQKKYKEKNREKVKQIRKKYYENNREKIIEQQKEYYETENGFKNSKINLWKRRGVVCDNFDALYDHYTSTAYCDYCKVELTIDKENTSTTKCLDHCHETGLFRNILCLSCNTKRGQNNF